ncbi:MAG TPA: STAS domain-containing protein [Acidimicrobiia bacterium]|jgi:anti-anti-sigma regulatory factor
MAMQIFIDELRPGPTEVRLVLRGQLRAGAGDELTQRLGVLLSEGLTSITVDLAGITALDREGFGVLVQLQRFARAADVAFHVEHAPPLLEHLLARAEEGVV